MLSKMVFSSLTSIIALNMIAFSSAAEQETKPDSPAEVHSLQLGSMELKAEEIDFKIHRDGKHLINLQGQAVIQIDKMTFSAGSIEATYTKKQEDVVLKLSDHVEIFSKTEPIRAKNDFFAIDAGQFKNQQKTDQVQFRAKALSAEVDFGKKFLTLKSGEGKHVTLIQINGSKTTEIEASQLEMSFKDSDTLFLKTRDALKLNEKKVKFNTKPIKRKPTKGNQFNTPFGPGTGPFKVPEKSSLFSNS